MSKPDKPNHWWICFWLVMIWQSVMFAPRQSQFDTLNATLVRIEQQMQVRP